MRQVFITLAHSFSGKENILVDKHPWEIMDIVTERTYGLLSCLISRKATFTHARPSTATHVPYVHLAFSNQGA